jgi:hypothetical protein
MVWPPNFERKFEKLHHRDKGFSDEQQGEFTIVTGSDAVLAKSKVSLCGFAELRSMPISRMTSTTSG